MRTKQIILLLLVLIPFNAFSQKAEDSLRAEIALMGDDRLKVKALNDLAFKYRNFAPKETIALSEEALALSKKLKTNFDKPRSLSFIGIGYQRLGEQGKALGYYTKAKEAAVEVGDKEEIAYSYHNMGTIYNWQDNYKRAIELFYKSLKMFEEINQVRGIAYVHNSLSLLASKQGNLDVALEHAKQTLEIRTSLEDKRGIAVAYNRLGEVYIKKKDVKNALFYFLKNIDYYESINDLEGLAFTNINISNVYMTAKDYKKSLVFSKKGVDYHTNIGNYGVVVQALYRMAEASFYRKEYQNAEKYCNQITPKAKEYNRPEILFQTYLLLSKIKEAQGNYDTALTYHQDYVTIKDSLFNAEMYRTVGWEQGSFEIFQKEQENLLLKEKEAVSEALIQKQEILQWSLVTGLILVCSFVLLLIRTNRQRKEDNHLLTEKNEQIELQKTAIMQQSSALTEVQSKLKIYNEDLEKQVEKRTEALENSNRKLELYANLASHDLKQPLRNIAGFSQLIVRHLKKKGLEDDTIKEFTQFILDGTQYMHHLIEDLLSFSKFSMDSHKKNFEKVNYQSIIDSVLQHLHQTIQDENATISIEKMSIVGDGAKIQLTQLFQNMISNALKFRKKEVLPLIQINATDIGTHYQFSVKDNGIGVEEKYFETIFETFKKLHSKQEYAGMGLGLSTCAEIVEEHQGKIWLESTLGEGSTFYFTIAKTI